MKPILRLVGSKPVTPFLRAAAACRTTPAPTSTRYDAPFTTIAVHGPERSGSGNGVPVPRRTICVLGAAVCACKTQCDVKNSRNVSTRARHVRQQPFIAPITRRLAIDHKLCFSLAAFEILFCLEALICVMTREFPFARSPGCPSILLASQRLHSAALCLFSADPKSV